MISRLVQYGGRILIVLALVGLPLSATRVVAKQKETPNISGTWKLNVEASTNPNGPAAVAAAGRPRGAAGVTSVAAARPALVAVEAAATRVVAAAEVAVATPVAAAAAAAAVWLRRPDRT